MIDPELLSLLPTLDVLLAERNVTRAAARLGFSQSRTSARLARLRELLDDPLLSPALHGRGMVLTPRALALKAELVAPFSALAAALSPPPRFDPLSSKHTFRIIANDNSAAIAGSSLVMRLQGSDGAGIRLAFLHLDRHRFAEQLENGEADVVLASEALVSKQPSLVTRVLLRDRFATARRRGKPSQTRPFDVDAFCSLDHVMISPSGGFNGPIDEALAALGRARRITVSVPTYLLAVSLVARTHLVATLPSRLLSGFGDILDVLETPLDLPPFNLAMGWHPRMQTDAAHVWLRENLVVPALD